MAVKFKIGLAITTYNRGIILADQIAAIRRFTLSEIIIVICDDGSTDDTVAIARQSGADVVIAGANHGIAWNKNRGLYYLHVFTDCDVFILMDDDVFPNKYGWEAEWAAASVAYGHVNFCRTDEGILCGFSTATIPGLSNIVAGPCLGFSRECIAWIGYFDVRFGRYGHEHSDMSYRSIRVGMGGVEFYVGADKSIYFYVISSGFTEIAMPSNIDVESLERNTDLLVTSGQEDVYRNPWRTSEQQREFLEDVFSVCRNRHVKAYPQPIEFVTDQYLAANPDVASASIDPLKHFLTYGMREGRRLRPA